MTRRKKNLSHFFKVGNSINVSSRGDISKPRWDATERDVWLGSALLA